jgi:serine/threonine-protein kinase HipA
MRLAQKMEIETPKVDLLRIKNVSYFVIERYDRKNVQHHTLPIHQEDFCQALGVLPELKYENEGGPNIAQCARLIAQNSIRPPHDKQQFLDRIIFNFLIGNNDAHGKNYSFLYLQRQPQLAPAYDLLSTEIYPELSKKMAMKIGGKYKPNEVFLRHWHKTFAQGLLGQHILEQHLQFFSQTLITKSEMLAQELGQSEIYSPVFNQIIRFITLRAKTFSSF